MSIKHALAGSVSVIVAGGFLATPGIAADMQLHRSQLDRQPIKAIQLEATSTLSLGQARQLINQRVSNQAVQRDLNAITEKIQKLRSPELVGAWGLGCGAGCGGSKDFTRMRMEQRTAAIKAARISSADRAVLLDINRSIGNLAQKPGSQVAAWGLGCGGSCSRSPSDFGQMVRR